MQKTASFLRVMRPGYRGDSICEVSVVVLRYAHAVFNRICRVYLSVRGLDGAVLIAQSANSKKVNRCNTLASILTPI